MFIYFKKFFKFFFIFLISFSLFFTTFIPNSGPKLKNDLINIKNYNFDKSDLNIIISKIIKEKKKIKMINNVDLKLYFLIKKNIIFNINLIKSGLIVSKKEIFNILYKINFSDSFSIDLYKNFLIKNNILDSDFQNSIKKTSIQNQIKKCLFLINKSKFYKINAEFFRYKINFDNKNNNFKNKLFLSNKVNNYFSNCFFKFKYLEFSILSFKKNILLENNKLFDFYNEKKFIYSKQVFFRINLKFFCDEFEDRVIFISKNELNNIYKIKIDEFSLNNNYCLNFIKKQYFFNKIVFDLKNKYFKQKSFNFLKNIINYNSYLKSRIFFENFKNFSFKYKIFNVLDNKSKILMKKYIKDYTLKDLIEVNKNKFLFFFPCFDLNKNIYFLKFINSFLNLKLDEKSILIDFLLLKKNKKIVKLNYDKNLILFKMFNKSILENNKFFFIKYKDFYYLIKGYESFKNPNNQYSLIKQQLNEIYN